MELEIAPGEGDRVDPIALGHAGGSELCQDTDPECADNPTDGCDVRDKDFILTQDYNFPAGIDVCKSNRIVDCQGHKLTGTDRSGHYCIEGSQTGFLSDNVVIRNCVIEGYAQEIRIFEPSSNNQIYGNTIRGTSIGSMQLWGVSDSVIHDNSIDTTNGFQFGIGTGGNNNIIHSNTLVGRGGGISVFGSNNQFTRTF